MINTSTSLISDVIGKDAESSAFVYGFYSFMDKIANGFAIERALNLYKEDACLLYTSPSPRDRG